MAKRYKVYRGDTFQLNLPVTLGGVTYDLTGCTLYWTLKRRPTDLDADALVQKTTGAGITHTDEAGGIALLVVAASIMDTMPTNRDLYYDVQLKDAAGGIWTLETGTLYVQVDTTRTVA